ncbi:hypothetical protein HY967_02250 [Candidatus Jorgensenbacteria bacterium]|nr:hypothetical protein [Candidatus Jorgensenbacteria bacterium]
MFRSIKKKRRTEEILGIIGLAYIVFLGFLVFVLVKFLVRSSVDSFKEAKIERALPENFLVGVAESALSE